MVCRNCPPPSFTTSEPVSEKFAFVRSTGVAHLKLLSLIQIRDPRVFVLVWGWNVVVLIYTLIWNISSDQRSEHLWSVLLCHQCNNTSSIKQTDHEFITFSAEYIKIRHSEILSFLVVPHGICKPLILHLSSLLSIGFESTKFNKKL